jgi:hypothetical protein
VKSSDDYAAGSKKGDFESKVDWTPTSSDPVNMGVWFDSEGISPYEDDVLQQGFQRAAKALTGQHP